MELPDLLQEFKEKFERAFAVHVPAKWDEEGGPYISADQPMAIAKVVIPILHSHLLPARIAYLFREDMKQGERVKLGVASKASSKIQFLSDHDFLIDFNWDAWRRLTHAQRIALVDHELCHCAIDYETSKWTVRHHDVEEFGEIVRRWGLWKPDLATFSKDVQQALAQVELFAGGAVDS